MVTVELPRFTEPLVRLELRVVHDVILHGGRRHVVEIQALSATGRILLTSQLRARPLKASCASPSIPRRGRKAEDLGSRPGHATM
jgi:hypothetical protein